MRRASGIAWSLLLAAVLLLIPLAQAQSSGSSPKLRIPVGALGLVLMAAGGILLFFLSLSAARRARGLAKTKAPPRRSFERGHQMGLTAGVSTEQDALRRLGEAPVGKLVSATPIPGGWRVAMSRKRSEPCEVAAGYVSGLFEAAWARDVVLRHEGCAGKARGAVCVYEVRDPFGRRPTRGDARTEGASIPGSEDARRRWPPARPGGA